MALKMKWAGTRNVCFFTWSYFLQLFDGVYFSFFNPLKVTDELEIESLGWIHGGELGGGELVWGETGINLFDSCWKTCCTVEGKFIPSHTGHNLMLTSSLWADFYTSSSKSGSNNCYWKFTFYWKPFQKK